MKKIFEIWNQINLAMFNFYVKSLPKHYDDHELYLNSDIQLSFQWLTEIWLTDDKQFYEFPVYSCINIFQSRISLIWFQKIYLQIPAAKC